MSSHRNRLDHRCGGHRQLGQYVTVGAPARLQSSLSVAGSTTLNSASVTNNLSAAPSPISPISGARLIHNAELVRSATLNSVSVTNNLSRAPYQFANQRQHGSFNAEFVRIGDVEFGSVTNISRRAPSPIPNQRQHRSFTT